MNAVTHHGRPLSHCVACLVAETPGQRKTLETLATRTGFGGLALDETGIGYPMAGERRLPFFFFHSLVSDGLLQEGISRIRTDERYRFSPALVVIGECSVEDVLRYVHLGFDD